MRSLTFVRTHAYVCVCVCLCACARVFVSGCVRADLDKRSIEFTQNSAHGTNTLPKKAIKITSWLKGSMGEHIVRGDTKCSDLSDYGV